VTFEFGDNGEVTAIREAAWGALEPFKPWIMEGKGYKGGQKQPILAGCTELLHA